MKNLIIEIAIRMNDYKVNITVDEEYNVHKIIALQPINEGKQRYMTGQEVKLSKSDLKFLEENLREEYIPFTEEDDIEE